LKEALQQQAATGAILAAISSSTSELQPILDMIAKTASRMCDAESANIFQLRDGKYHLTATNNTTGEFVRYALEHPLPPGRGSVAGRAALEQRTIHLPDCLADPEYQELEFQRAGRYRTILGVPLQQGGTIVGVIVLMRARVMPFTERQIELVTTFANQAVIAIENARLFNETGEALARQNATADVLKVIASSPGDLAPVFDAMLESAMRLCEASHCVVWRFDGERLHAVAARGDAPFTEWLREHSPLVPMRGTAAHFIQHGEDIVHRADRREEEAYSSNPVFRDLVDTSEMRASLCVAVRREGTLLGMINVYRQEVRPFSDRQIALLQSFADQAVIAIENAGLFEEVQAKTRDLEESLQQQTATADVLKVISRSIFDLKPVLDTVVTTAAQLCDADMAMIFRRESEVYRLAVSHGFPPDFEAFMRKQVISPGRDSMAARTALEGRIVHVADVTVDPDYRLPEAVELGNTRTALGVPLQREGETIGTIVLVRQRVEPFVEREIELVQTFADQAVIAIENVRLFGEVQARTRDLTEALTYQTGSANILNVIASSPTDVKPVLKSIVESACELCEAYDAVVILKDGEELQLSAHHGPIPMNRQRWANDRTSASGRAIADRQPVHVHDVQAAEGLEFPMARAMSLVDGCRTLLSAPLLREGEAIGAIALRRSEAHPFSDKQVALLQTFADQAVIAIGNVRLFDEVQAKTRDLEESLQQQTATADVLKVISRSAFDLQTVLDTLTESATQLADADMGSIARRDERGYYHATGYKFAVGWVRIADPFRLQPGRDSVVGRALLAKKAVQIADVITDPEYDYPDIQKAAGYRTLLGVPMMRQGEAIGVLFLGRRTVKPFSDKQIELVSTFADQAVIAIENVRLFDEVQAKTSDLEESLQQQTATADVLKVISRSAFDLHAVLQTLVDSAARLCDADKAFITRQRDGVFYRAEAYGFTREFSEFVQDVPVKPERGTAAGRALLERHVVHISDVMTDPDYTWVEAQRLGDFRSILAMPMLREGTPVGVLILMRSDVRPFTDKQIELVTTFADQAVIAIENVRLFEEVQAKTSDLEESLQQQTAMADVLKVISRSAFDLQPVFDTVAENSARLCEADRAFIYRFDGELLRRAASYNAPPDFERWVAQHPMRLDRHSGSGRAALERRTIHIHDVRADPEYTFGAKDAEAIRTILGVPILKGDELLGVMMIYHLQVKPFTERQIALVETFADQAAIAIENVQLFREVQQRTDDLAESLQQQTATAEVLKVISRSTFDLPAVLHALVETAARLCNADKGTITRQKDGVFYRAESFGFSDEFMDYVRGVPVAVDRHSATGRALFDGVVVHIPDVEADREYTFREGQRLGDFRALLGVPMLREGVPIGVITLTRTEPEAFTDKQIELAITFADQAAIAIENVRLFDEVQERTRELSQSLDDLRKAQDRLIQTEKLASLGQLTAGIAHEIKNPLNFVNNFSALSVELTDELNELLDQAELAGRLRQEAGELTALLKNNLSKVVQHAARRLDRQEHAAAFARGKRRAPAGRCQRPRR
jgi:GAF domain-containing protein